MSLNAKTCNCKPLDDTKNNISGLEQPQKRLIRAEIVESEPKLSSALNEFSNTTTKIEKNSYFNLLCCRFCSFFKSQDDKKTNEQSTIDENTFDRQLKILDADFEWKKLINSLFPSNNLNENNNTLKLISQLPKIHNSLRKIHPNLNDTCDNSLDSLSTNITHSFPKNTPTNESGDILTSKSKDTLEEAMHHLDIKLSDISTSFDSLCLSVSDDILNKSLNNLNIRRINSDLARFTKQNLNNNAKNHKQNLKILQRKYKIIDLNKTFEQSNQYRKVNFKRRPRYSQRQLQDSSTYQDSFD
jgi:hypothetical protein